MKVLLHTCFDVKKITNYISVTRIVIASHIAKSEREKNTLLNFYIYTFND